MGAAPIKQAEQMRKVDTKDPEVHPTTDPTHFGGVLSVRKMQEIDEQIEDERLSEHMGDISSQVLVRSQLLCACVLNQHS